MGMPTRMLSLLAIVAVASVLGGEQPTHQPRDGVPVYSEGKATNNEIELSVRMARENVAGEAASIEVTLTNHGAAAVSYGYIDYYRDWHFAVSDTQGKPVAPTRFGVACMAEGQSYKKFVRYKLASGASYKIIFNLARLFDLTVPGDYSVTVAKDINPLSEKKFVVQVPDLKFTVSEPLLVHTDQPAGVEK